MHKYAERDDVRFVIVYTREPHARQMAFGDVPQPCTEGERAALAERTVREFELDADVWIDDLGDQSRRAFGDLPHWAIVVDADGRLRHKLPWADPDELEQEIDDELRWQRHTPQPAESTFLQAVREKAAPPDGDATTNPEQTAAQRHDRHTMLAWLVEHEPEHPERKRWLLELAGEGPLRQREWATRLLREPERAAPPTERDASNTEKKQ